MLQTLKNIVFRISPDEVAMARQGFGACEPQVEQRLDAIGRVFADGYRLALETPDEERLAAALDAGFDAHHVGFAYEGAGFYFGLLDVLLPRRKSRLRAFAEGAARKHDYLVTVGAGFALARMPWGHRRLGGILRKLDPLLAWCVPDGYGFHQGFFHHQTYVEQHAAAPEAWPPYARALFDAGVGRSLWWVCGADPARLAGAIGGFPQARRAELWCGVGLACAYAGGVDEAVVEVLPVHAGRYHADLRSGASFAARMRQKGHNPSPWTETVCQAFIGKTADGAADRLVAEQNAVLARLPEADAERGGRCYLVVRKNLTARLRERDTGGLRQSAIIGHQEKDPQMTDDG